MESSNGKDELYLDRLEQVSCNPLFVMGDHRSGTTILYKILGESGCFNITTSYHILRFHQLLYDHFNGSVEQSKRELVEHFEELGMRDRGIDRMALNPEMPEEYGFILKGGSFRLWLKPSNRDDLLLLCKKIQLISDPSLPTLLKNPWDYFLNFMYIKKIFPESKFVFVHRDPVATINSQLRAMRESLENRNAYLSIIAEWYRDMLDSPIRRNVARFMFRGERGLKMATRHLVRGSSYYLKNVASLPPDDVVDVRYEDLCREPDKTVRGILHALKVPEKGEVDYASMIRPREPRLYTEVEEHRQWIASKLRPYCDRFGYSPEPGDQ